MLPNAEATVAFTRSGLLWFKHWTAVGLMARLAFLGISPRPGDYAARLERAGFRVDSIALIPRPTPLPGDIIGYLETFALNFFQGFPDEARSDYLQEVRTVLEPQLCDADGHWVADYVRLRFATTKVCD
ncbi:MAG: hypothetical protein NVS1B11_06230 [Terriglobales bacterium]